MKLEGKPRLSPLKQKKSGPFVMRVTLFTILFVALLWIGIKVYLATMGDG